MSTRNPIRLPPFRVSGLIAVLVVVAALPAAGAGPAAAATGSYVVVYRDGVNVDAKVAASGVTPSHRYRAAVSGFAAPLTAGQLARIRSDPDVLLVEADVAVVVPSPDWGAALAGTKLDAKREQVIPTGIRRIGSLDSPTASIDGIDDRVDVDVAIIDGGIDESHPDLNVAGAVSCNGKYSATGHGTHVSGTVGALDNGHGVVGVAPGARIWSVQVLDPHGNGSLATTICGIDWVTAHADVIEVANMSLGAPGEDDGACGSISGDALHAAVCAAVGSGVTFVVAAMNHAIDASQLVPASYDEVITVSALADWDGLPGGFGQPSCGRADGADDALAVFSNFGADVDLAAPGTCILSTWRNGRYEESTGTSMSSPHVAGAAALYLETHPTALPADVRAVLLELAEPGPIPGDPDPDPEGVLDVSAL